jgi:hypothetical protein
VVVKNLNNSKIAQKDGPVESPLLRGVRQGVVASLRQKHSIAIDTLLAQYPEMLGHVVLAAIDDLARDGVISIEGSYCGSVGVTLRGDSREAVA